MENGITPDESILIEENSDEYEILFHTTGEDDEYLKFLAGLDEIL